MTGTVRLREALAAAGTDWTEVADHHALAGGFDAAERERIALYRAYLHLIMWIEAVPRQNDDKRLAWLRGFAFEPLAKPLDRWAASRT